MELGRGREGPMINQRALKLKKKLATGACSPGLWISIPSPTSCEIVAGAGFDWVVVDTEHSPFNPETLQNLLMAFTGTETVAIPRVPWNDPVLIKQALDMGWDGVLTPQTNTPEEARRAVEACRYPPLGNRGFGPRRAGNYYRDQAEYVRLANDMVICAIQIENVSALRCIEEIVSVPGIDWLFVGPCDMSGSLGKFLELRDGQLWDAIRQIFRTAQKAGIPTGDPLSGLGNLEETLALGCQLVCLGEDTSFLQQATDNALSVFSNLMSRNRRKA